MPPDLIPVDYDPFSDAAGAFPTFDAAAPARPLGVNVDLLTGNPIPDNATQAPVWMKKLIGAGGERRHVLWPEQMVRRAMDVVHSASQGENQLESAIGVPGAQPASSQDVQYAPNMLGRALGMTEPWYGPGSESGLAKVQDLSGLMASGPLIDRPGTATLRTGLSRPGEAALPKVEPTELMNKYQDVVKSLRKYPDWHETDPEILVHKEGLAPEEASQLIADMKDYDQRVVNAAPSLTSGQVPPFYSAVEAAVRNASQAAMTPEQWRGYLTNRPGVKKEELDWIGLPEGEKVSKQEMLDHAREHGVQVKEIEKKGGDGEPPLTEDEYYSGLDEHTREAVLNDYPMKPGESPDAYYERVAGVWDHYQEAAADQLAQQGILHPDDVAAAGGPKFSEYQLPGGENYREKLFTLPTKARAFDDLTPVQKTDLKTRYEREFGEGSLESERDLREYHDQYLAKDQGASANYQSSHWDEPNVLAHVRMNDRTVPDVGKTLHLEELQSDWHQAGRKEGYKQEVPKEQIDAVRDARQTAFRDLGETMAGLEKKHNNTLTAQEFNRVSEAVAQARSLDEIDAIVKKYPMFDMPEFYKAAGNYNETYRASQDLQKKAHGVPDAPFKTTWPDLVLKRMIREAAENGYDAISWTPGEAQAARYDLSKQIRAVHYTKTDKGYLLAPESHTGAEVPVNNGLPIPESKLADYIGKEIAEKIVKGAIDNDTHTLTNVDLKIGGEGMKGFYDKILVDKANALAKKFGGKVEQKPLRGLSVEESPEAFLIKDSSGSVVDQFKRDNYKTVEAARKAAEAFVAQDKVPVLRLTPQMKDTALRKGFPLFAAGVPFPLEPVDHDPFKEK